ncbi:N-acetylmuramoyl-L-alanine amidase family protein [Ureibacillus composti]
MIKVAYGAGHGGFGVTPGKRSPDGEYEWDFNTKVATAFANELALFKGVMTKRFDDPSGKTDVPLVQRTDGANRWGANYYISFHHNAFQSRWGSHSGVETWIYTNAQEGSVALANAIHPAVVEGYGLIDRGIKRGNLHIVRETTMPAILIEGGFMDSTIDIQKLRNDSVLNNVGKLIARAFANYVGLKQAVTIKEEVEDELEFYSPTLKEVYEYRSISPVTEEFLVKQAIKVLGYNEKYWLERLQKGEVKEGDKAAIAYELALYYGKQNL